MNTSQNSLFSGLEEFLCLQQKLQVSSILEMFVEANLNKTLSYLVGDKKLTGYITRALNSYGPEDVFKSVEIYTKISNQVSWPPGISATGALGFFKDPEESNIGNFHICLPIKTMLKQVPATHPVAIEYWEGLGLKKASVPQETLAEVEFSKRTARLGANMINNLLSKVEGTPTVPELLRLLLAFKMTKDLTERAAKGFTYEDSWKILRGLSISKNSEGKSLWEIPWGKLSTGALGKAYGIRVTTDELPESYLSTYYWVQPIARKYVEKFWRDVTSKK